jgi:threonine dehydratase
VIQSVRNPDTIADGARTSAPGDITFPLIMRYVSDMLTVDDGELLRAMWYLWERLKIIVEPTGALGAAALLEDKLESRGKRIGVILSGGNADFKRLAELL